MELDSKIKKIKTLKKENKRLQKLVDILQEEKKSLESIIMLQNTLLATQPSKINETYSLNQKTIYNPFTPWTNCCASICYPDGFNPQANWCKNLE